MDFYEGGSNSRSRLRMRKAYVNLAWGDFAILAGQTTEVIAPLYATVNSDLAMWGAGNLGDRRPQIRFTYAPTNDDGIRALAAEIVGDETDPMRKARLIYDWELDHVDYWVKYPDRLRSSGVGSSEYCLTEATGNCTDFHSLYAALSRAAGIPTRIVYGSFFKQPLDGVDRDQSYHCWIEFYCPGRGWVPLDVAVADVFVGDFPDTPENTEKVDLTVAAGYDGADPALVDYYFGNLEERRVSWCVGRDALLSPAPAAGRLNAVPKAHVEIDGAAVGEKQGWTRKLTFRER